MCIFIHFVVDVKKNYSKNDLAKLSVYKLKWKSNNMILIYTKDIKA